MASFLTSLIYDAICSSKSYLVLKSIQNLSSQKIIKTSQTSTARPYGAPSNNSGARYHLVATYSKKGNTYFNKLQKVIINLYTCSIRSSPRLAVQNQNRIVLIFPLMKSIDSLV